MRTLGRGSLLKNASYFSPIDRASWADAMPPHDVMQGTVQPSDGNKVKQFIYEQRQSVYLYQHKMAGKLDLK